MGLDTSGQRRALAEQFMIEHGCGAERRIPTAEFFATVRDGSFNRWVSQAQAEISTYGEEQWSSSGHEGDSDKGCLLAVIK